jgi:hypothetical protein
MEVKEGHLATINALPQVLGRQRAVPEVLGTTTATQITRQTRPLPRVQ